MTTTPPPNSGTTARANPWPRALLAALLLAALLPGPAWARLQASVDRSRIAMNDSIVLSIRADGGEDISDLDLTELERHFTIAGNNSSTEVRFSNGKGEAIMRRELILYPRHQGTLRIPPLGPPNVASAPINIIVEAARTNPDNHNDLYVEATVDRQTAYVQAQVLYTFRLLHAVPLHGNPQLTPLLLPNATVEELDTRSFQTRINGRPFTITELQYAIFPRQSGTLNIPSLTLTARLRGTRQGQFRLGAVGPVVRRDTPAYSVQVLPVPPQWPQGAPWLPLHRLELEENWSRLVSDLSMGDSVTRTITMTGVGLPGAQLPQVTQQVPAGIRLYPEQPTTENINGENGITGLGVSSAALLVTQPGQFRLPAVRVPWWDVNAGALQYAELPAIDIRVQEPLPGGAAGPGAGGFGEPGFGVEGFGGDGFDGPGFRGERGGEGGGQGGGRFGNPWFWSSLALLLAWLATLGGGAWLWMQHINPRARPPAETPAAVSERRRFRLALEACRGGDPQRARESLRDWGAALAANVGGGGGDDDSGGRGGNRSAGISGSARPSLHRLGLLAADAEVADALERLDRCLYGRAAEDWSGTDLANTLERWRRSQRGGKRDATDTALPALN